MKRKPYRALLLAALLFGVVTTRGQDSPGPKRARTPDDYKARTLREVAAERGDGRGNKEETMLVFGDILPSRVRVAYGGAVRPFPPAKKEVLRQWARLYAGAPESYTLAYETEARFSEGATTYWLAVRKSVLARLRKELKRGDRVDLYLIRVGASKGRDGWGPVILIENFQKAR